MKYVTSNISYPKSLEDRGIEGIIYIWFVVNKSGKMIDSKIVKGIDPLLGELVLEGINGMPDWTPGKQDGKPVNVKMTIPVKFKL